MSKSIDVLAIEYSLKWIPEVSTDDWWDKKQKKDKRLEIGEHFENGYKQRNDELIDLLVELEEYFEKRQDADWEGEERGLVPNKEMQFYGQLKDELEKMEVK